MKISIITSTFNAALHLPRCRDSILQQSFRDIEWIVQDGGSTDGTLNLLKDIDDPRLSWHSEPDSGIYDAWNKALERTSGDWIIFLGGDDFFLGKDTLRSCAEHLSRLESHIDIAYGAVFMFQRSSSKYALYNRPLWLAYEMLTSRMGLTFTSTFLRAVRVKEKKFDPSFKILGDFDLTVRLAEKDNIAPIPVIVCGMQEGGVSNHQETQALMQQERVEVWRRYLREKAAVYSEAALTTYELPHPPLVNGEDLRRFRRARKKLLKIPFVGQKLADAIW